MIDCSVITFILLFHLQMGRIPMPIDELCFIDEGKQVENLQGPDVRGNFARPMTASGH